MDEIYENYQRNRSDPATPVATGVQYILGDPLEELNYSFHQDGEHKFLYNEFFLSALLTHFGFVSVHHRLFDPKVDPEHRRDGTHYMVAAKP